MEVLYYSNSIHFECKIGSLQNSCYELETMTLFTVKSPDLNNYCKHSCLEIHL